MGAGKKNLTLCLRCCGFYVFSDMRTDQHTDLKVWSLRGKYCHEPKIVSSPNYG